MSNLTTFTAVTSPTRIIRRSGPAGGPLTTAQGIDCEEGSYFVVSVVSNKKEVPCTFNL